MMEHAWGKHLTAVRGCHMDAEWTQVHGVTGSAAGGGLVAHTDPDSLERRQRTSQITGHEPFWEGSLLTITDSKVSLLLMT